MSAYVIHVLLDVSDDTTNEATQEATNLDHALNLIRNAVCAVPAFRAITLCHIEDFPNLMQGADSR